MSQTTLTSYFNSRKRAATDDIVSTKNKVPHIERTQETKALRKAQLLKKCELFTNNVKPIVEKVKDIKVDGKNKNGNVQINVAQNATQTQPIENTVFSKKLNASNIATCGEPSKISTANSARKELSLGDIRKRLAGSSRLAELRASAERISKGIKQVKEATEKPNLKEFKSIDVEVPVR